MRLWGRAALVPVIALVLWLVPSSNPSVETARATSAALADLPEQVASAPPEATSARASTTTTVDVAPVVDDEVSEPATTEPPSSTTTTTSTTTLASSTAPTLAESSTVAPTSEQTSTTQALSMGDQALLRVAYPWRSTFPEWEVVFRGPRSGIRALTYPQEKRIEIFVRSSDTVASLHRVFAHELGHVVDVELNSDADRQRWRDQRGIGSSPPWWPNAEAPDFATGAGDFAEAFAVWETGVTTRSTVAGQPTASDLALLEELSRG